MEQALIKNLMMKSAFDNRLKNDINLMQQGTNDLVGSIYVTNNKLAEMETNMKIVQKYFIKNGK